jgi:hypothetical protein
MKTRISSWVVPTTLAMTLAVTTVALAEERLFQLIPSFSQIRWLLMAPLEVQK